jgi:predicted RecB family nuclease
MSDTVIVPRQRKAGRNGKHTFHSDVCRVVWMIDDKRYVTREFAEAWDYEECEYCAGEYEEGVGTGRQQRKELLNTGEE